MSPSTSSAPSHQTPQNYSLDVSMCRYIYWFCNWNTSANFGKKIRKHGNYRVVTIAGFVVLAHLPVCCQQQVRFVTSNPAKLFFGCNHVPRFCKHFGYFRGKSESTEMAELLRLLVLLCWLFTGILNKRYLWF